MSVKESFTQRFPSSRVRETRIEDFVAKLLLSTGNAVVKVEPNLILRGSAYPPQILDLCPAAQEHFEAFVSVQTLSVPDLYGGKLCAALDRQHPRDLFDVKLLLDDTGITPEIRRAFVVYLAGHDRPMHELLLPKLQDITQLYADHFRGMPRIESSLEDLIEIQYALSDTLVRALDDDEKEFLLSVKRGEPEWDRLGIDHLSRLPAIQWKVANIRKMGPEKHKAAVDQLMKVLDV